MKCANCGNDLFPEQFRCERCGTIVELGLAKKGNEKKEPKKDVALKDLRDK